METKACLSLGLAGLTSPPSSSIHEILVAEALGGLPISFSGSSSQKLNQRFMH